MRSPGEATDAGWNTTVAAQRDCIFCRIIAGELPCHKVMETGKVLSIMDIHPASEGHTLVIPKRHCESVFDIDAEDMQAVALAARRIAAAIRAELAPDGMTVTQANGVAAGQTVMHYHVHLIPRTAGERMLFHGEGETDPKRLVELARAFAARL